MEGHGLALTVNPSLTPSLFPSFTPSRTTTRSICFTRKPKFVVLASKDEPNIDQWDQMELKFGRMLGEDPKLTIAKIMGRKLNPEMSYLEIEKAFYKKQGKSSNTEVEEVPFDASRDGQSSNSPSGLNLIRPVPKKGVKFEASNKPVISETKKPSQPVRAAINTTKGHVPNVILRKPTTFKEDDIENEKSSKLRIRPNLVLKMGKGQTKEKFSDITLLKKPEPIGLRLSPDKEQEPSENAKVSVSNGAEGNDLKTAASDDMGLLNKPGRSNLSSNICQEQEFSGDDIGMNSGDDLKETSLEGENFSVETVNKINGNFDDFLNTRDASLSRDPMLEDDSATGLQSLGNTDMRSEAKLEDSGVNFSIEAALQGKPKRLDQYVKGTSNVSRQEAVVVNSESNGNTIELENFLAVSAIKDHEDMDWTKVEDLVKTGGRAEVELISCSTRGFVVSFGSLVGFLPYRNLAARWKFLAFESWLRRKGLDPSFYKQNLGIIGSFDATNMTTSRDSSPLQETDQKLEREISPDMQLEEILRIYDQEKLKFLSSFVGQKIKVNVILADRRSRRLIFSVKPKEKEELVEKKRGLMARLSIGDVVKCYIKKITYFGIFVEVEGVPALIHQSEVSWDATLDPASYFKVGQIVDAKVHQLDFSLGRIFLSLREIAPDPLSEALEAVIGDHDSLDGRLEAAEADTEWPDVESLIKELQQFKGIQSVSKGRFFLSPGLAPTFQVYMASMFENQYKLLARSGNKVQEVIVQTSLGKEDMKSTILTCANRVG